MPWQIGGPARCERLRSLTRAPFGESLNAGMRKSQHFVTRLTHLLQNARVAKRPSSLAHLAAMLDHLVREGNPAGAGNERHQIPFDLFRGVGMAQIQPT